MPPDEARRRSAPQRPTPSNVENSTPDEAERKRIADIIQGLRLTLPEPTPEQRRWNEAARNRVELAAYVSGHRRVCDLPERV